MWRVSILVACVRSNMLGSLSIRTTGKVQIYIDYRADSGESLLRTQPPLTSGMAVGKHMAVDKCNLDKERLVLQFYFMAPLFAAASDTSWQ